MITPDKAKTATNRSLQTIATQSPGTDEALMEALWPRYISDTVIPPCTLRYTGHDNPTLYAPITVADVQVVVHASQRNTVPGANKITNAIIRNLSWEQIQAHTDYINDEQWDKGVVPPDWRHPDIITIPNPGKKPTLDVLCLISLTSCLGKLN